MTAKKPAKTQFAKTVVSYWTKRLYHVWETRFASLIGRSKIRNAFHTTKFDAKISVFIKYKKLPLILRTEKFWRLQGVANRWPCYSNLSRQSEFIGLISCKMQWCSHTPIPWKAWILAECFGGIFYINCLGRFTCHNHVVLLSYFSGIPHFAYKGMFTLEISNSTQKFQLYTNATIDWIQGYPPVDVPRCGFYNEKCGQAEKPKLCKFMCTNA